MNFSRKCEATSGTKRRCLLPGSGIGDAMARCLLNSFLGPSARFAIDVRSQGNDFSIRIAAWHALDAPPQTLASDRLIQLSAINDVVRRLFLGGTVSRRFGFNPNHNDERSEQLKNRCQLHCTFGHQLRRRRRRGNEINPLIVNGILSRRWRRCVRPGSELCYRDATK